MTAQEKIKILKYAERHGVKQTALKFKITERTIYRYKNLYDGTLTSLEDKPSTPKSVHPNAHTQEEIENIKYLLKKYPYISHRELYEKLKKEFNYTRHSGGLYNYLRRNHLISEPKLKSEYATMFDKDAVKALNGKFVFANKESLPLYIIEVNDSSLFVATVINNGYPCYLTVYYSAALKFSNKDDADIFIKSINNTSEFKLKVRELNL